MAERDVPTAHPTAKPGRNERRASVRYVVDEHKSKILVASVGYGSWPACVRDISPQGIGIFLNRRLSSGSKLKIELQNTARNITVNLDVRVAHAVQQHGGWFMGCSFTRPLTDQELQELLL